MSEYTSPIYGLTFLAMSLILIGKVRKTTSSPFKNIFWSFTAFSIMKAVSILSGLSSEFFPSEDMLLVSNMLPPVIIGTITVISSVVSNAFLFHFGISILTYKTFTRIDYKFFPVLSFLAYMTLYLSGILEFYNVEKISRHSLGFNGALLGGIGCFNLFSIKIKSDSMEKRLLSGLIICGIALIFYSFTEGIITSPVFGVQVKLLRIFSAIVLFISSFFIVDLLEERENRNRIGFI